MHKMTKQEIIHWFYDPQEAKPVRTPGGWVGMGREHKGDLFIILPSMRLDRFKPSSEEPSRLELS